ncbi:NAD-dependent epimerase/dehydratase family protein [Nitrosococcus wardiae]|uniref:NAD-dependent epimerase/dehydratase family protein n=1 Tax=Nitrosococcus wardiae TaxID=1814290 RepID=A0A4P7C095_9GAMM|nr:NAD-dependent epimerase/dehydratase family protein [Nitrosococcus wardiae]QBQ55968.1 NAD-dependent epimerase/dehydratase family protein [Nitrosococcus wardiae]
MTHGSLLNTRNCNQPLRWLITGGCGFIGTSLIKQLVSEGGHAIRVIDNLSVGTRDDLSAVCDFTEVAPSPSSPPVQLVVGDILDETLALKVTQGVDVVVHLAANTGVAPSVEDPRKDCTTNVIGTLNYLEGARLNGVKRFVFASSGAPVGEVEPPIHEELAPHPASPYGASKLAGEGYCSAYYRTFGIETVALRFGNVYGPGSGHKNSVVAKFIRQALNGETLEIYGDGSQTRDFIYIDDLIQAIYLATTVHGIGGEVFQVANNAETTIQEMLDKLVPLLGESGFSGLKVDYTTPRIGDVKRNYSDTSKAREQLGWISKYGLDKGIEKTVSYFVSQKKKALRYASTQR